MAAMNLYNDTVPCGTGSRCRSLRRVTRRSLSRNSGFQGRRGRPRLVGHSSSETSRSIEQTMPNKNDEAVRLASMHYQVETGLTHVFRILGDGADVEDRPGEPIKLLEVNENTVPSGILPIQFGPSPASGLFYPSVILEVTPDEYRRIQRAELELP